MGPLVSFICRFWINQVLGFVLEQLDHPLYRASTLMHTNLVSVLYVQSYICSMLPRSSHCLNITHIFLCWGVVKTSFTHSFTCRSYLGCLNVHVKHSDITWPILLPAMSSPNGLVLVGIGFSSRYRLQH